MDKKNIKPEDFNCDIFNIFDKDWMLLTAGTLGGFNTMTISWGFMGTLWFKNIVIVGVRPQRYTFEFMEKSDSFTLNAFGEDKRDILNFCGSKSGREVNKAAACNLSAVPSEEVAAPAFAEAKLIIECRKLYSDSLKGKNFIDKSIIRKVYGERDFHKLYIAEVVNILGV